MKGSGLAMTCRVQLLLAAAAAVGAAVCAGAASTDPRVEHLVLLVLENRGFDHMLGVCVAAGSRALAAQRRASCNCLLLLLLQE